MTNYLSTDMFENWKSTTIVSDSNQISTFIMTNCINRTDDVIEYPNDTSALVQSLGIKQFVNSSIQNMAAFYITDINGQPFESYAQLSSTTSADTYCGGKQWTPQRNDYCIVREDETKIQQGTGKFPTSRYIYNPGVSAVSSEYDPSKWEFQYTINDSGFTQEQLNAINSGISNEKVEKYDRLSSNTDIQAALSNKVDKNTSIITIGEKPAIQNNGNNCIGIGYNTGSPDRYSTNNVVIGQNCAVYSEGSTSIVIGTDSNILATARNYSNIAIGNKAFISANANNACQLGSGTNGVANSLQYISTPIVVNGKIPTQSLQACFSSEDTADLTTSEGIKNAVKSILLKLGMQEENIVS